MTGSATVSATASTAGAGTAAALHIRSVRPAAVARAPLLAAYSAVTATAGTVWVAGPGFLARSADGGRTWHTDASAAAQGVAPRQIVFVDADHGWLIGPAIDSCTGGHCTDEVVATTDGGVTWHLRYRTTAMQISDAQFVSPDVGYAEGLPSGPCTRRGGCAELLRTADGGASWQVVASAVTPAGGVYFRDAAHGWLVGDRCTARAACRVGIFATAHGGRSWVEQVATDIPAGRGAGALAFTDARHGWALIGDTGACTMGGCWGELYSTANAGGHWSLLQRVNRWRMTATDRAPGFPGQPVFASTGSGWIPISAGAGPGVGGIARTVDGGHSWTRVGAGRGWSIGAVADAGHTLWAVGGRAGVPTASFLIRSTDGGRTWTQVLPALTPTRALDFVTTGDGYGLGDASDPAAVLSTADGGRTWRISGRVAGAAAPSALSFAGRTGYVGDASGHLSRSTDAGRTWRALPAAGGPVVYLRFFDAAHGMRITSRPTAGGPTLAIATTSDAGATWSATASVPADAGFAAAAFPTDARGWLVTGLGTLGYRIRRTTDGGASWTPGRVLAGAGLGPGAAFFLTPSFGWIAVGSRLLATGDGGASWRAWQLGPLRVRALDFISAHRGWALDRTGSLWRTNDGGASWRPLA